MKRHIRMPTAEDRARRRLAELNLVTYRALVEEEREAMKAEALDPFGPLNASELADLEDVGMDVDFDRDQITAINLIIARRRNRKDIKQ